MALDVMMFVDMIENGAGLLVTKDAEEYVRVFIVE
jgi:hypothetical protein